MTAGRRGAAVGATLASCAACLAWGHAFTRGLCAACYMFARDHAVDVCVGCRRRQPLRNSYCRSCWNQARLHARQSGQAPGVAIASQHLHQVRHHQLFFANLLSSRGASTTAPRRQGRAGRPRKPPPPTARRPVTGWVQPVLFDGLRRDFTRFTEPRRSAIHSPWVAWAHYRAHLLGESRGWTRRVRIGVNRALIILLSGHCDGDLIRYSEMFPALRALDLSVERTADVLADMAILLDDRQSIFEQWLPRKLDGITAGIADETEAWLRLLHQGGTRSRARSMQTAWQYLNMLRPVLLAWSSHAEHLREITRQDVLTALDELHGVQRQSTLIALRSLFGTARKTGVIFRNPTSRIPVGERESRLIQPLNHDQVQRTIAAASRPADPLIIALAAVHAARRGAIRELQLDDVDRGNRRLTVGGRARPLDELTHQLMINWLDYRRSRWPNTANPHLLVNQMTAMETGPVSGVWLRSAFHGQDATLERLRVDRQLEEALTHRADPLHLAVVFGLDEKTAIRYATAARALLPTPIEAEAARQSTHE